MGIADAFLEQEKGCLSGLSVQTCSISSIFGGSRLFLDFPVSFIHRAPLEIGKPSVYRCRDKGGSGPSPVSALLLKCLTVASFFGALLLFALIIRFTETHECRGYGLLLILLGLGAIFCTTIILVQL